MKKVLYSAMVLSCALFASCTNDELIGEEAINDGQRITVTASLSNDSRTAYVDGEGVTKTEWVKGDAINLFYGDKANEADLKYTADADGATTTFTAATTNELTNPGTKTVYAFYPYLEGSLDTTVPVAPNSIQKWTGNNTAPTGTGNYAQNTAPLGFIYTSGQVEGSGLNLKNFKHGFAFIKAIITKDELHYEGSSETYTLVVKASTAIISDDMGFTFDIANEEFLPGLYDEMTKGKRISYQIDRSVFDNSDAVTCYIAVLPTDAAGDEISFLKKDPTGDVIATKAIPEGGLQANRVYTMTIGTPAEGGEVVTEDEFEGEYEYKCTLNGSEATGTATLTKNDDGTYFMTPAPGREGNENEYQIELSLSEDGGTQKMTMKAGQLLEMAWGSYPMNLTLIESLTPWEGYDNYVSSYVGTTDTSAEYVAEKQTVDGNIQFAFKDNGSWADHEVKGFAYMMVYNSYDMEYGVVYDLVLTKK